jgi:alpha/beta superfamily hydrolase
VNPKPLRHVDLYGRAGRLEAIYRELQDPAGIAVVCHPHPLGGGTLHNKVVFRAARGLEAANVATLRFNFRGVGASGGKHDEGQGELDDVNVAIDWAKKKHPGKKLIVGGFSFGAWVASRAACELPEVDAIFLIGTPVNKYDFSYLRHCEKPMLFVHGTQDEHGEHHHHRGRSLLHEAARAAGGDDAGLGRRVIGSLIRMRISHIILSQGAPVAI